MKLQRLLSLSLVFATLAVLLSACGGGDKEPTAIPPSPSATAEPATATASPAPALESTVVATPTPADVESTASSQAEASSAAGATIAVAVILTDYRISAFQKEFEVGKSYSFTIQNNGAVTHQFMIEPLSAINQPLTSGNQSAIVDGIEPGVTATLTWTFTEAGNYQFASHEKDYYEQGMVQSNIVVK